MREEAVVRMENKQMYKKSIFKFMIKKVTKNSPLFIIVFKPNSMYLKAAVKHT